MWLAKQQKRETEEVLPAVGAVTIGGDAPAVELDSERRDLAVYAPGGYRWRPTPGQKVLVLKADGELCVAGSPSGAGLEPGEVALDSAGGAGVKLDNQGNVAVTGTLVVGGTELTQLVRSIVFEILAEIGG